MGIDIRELGNKTVKSVHKSDGHGDALCIDFVGGLQLVVWAFNDPTDLQTVLWNPATGEVVRDERSSECKAYTEAVRRKLANRTPPVTYDTPFRVEHYPTLIPD